MALVSFNILDGFDAGRAFSNLSTPVSIGREEGNTVRLNDERISRFHLKVQEDGGHVVLTDLDSTNGTRVNGESVRVSLLRPGDQIHVGGTLLVFGSPEEILARMQRIAHSVSTEGREGDHSKGSRRNAELPQPPGAEEHHGDWKGHATDIAPIAPRNASSESETWMYPQGGPPSPLRPGHSGAHDEVWCQPPALPENLSPAQAAQLTELLAALHRRLREVIESVSIDQSAGSIRASLPAWLRVLSLQMDLARLMRQISEPNFQDF